MIKKSLLSYSEGIAKGDAAPIPEELLQIMEENAAAVDELITRRASGLGALVPMLGSIR